MKIRVKPKGAVGERLRGRSGSQDVLGEIARIVESAEAGVTQVVGVGSLVLFSTETGDAWVLDWEDARALCLLAVAKQRRSASPRRRRSSQLSGPPHIVSTLR